MRSAYPDEHISEGSHQAREKEKKKREREREREKREKRERETPSLKSSLTETDINFETQK